MEPARKGGKAAQMKMKRRDSTDENAENCPVCLTAFDDTVQRPRTLPCGHTFCTPCINGLKNQGMAMCPTCRVIHAVPEAGQFPITYTIEAFIRRLRSATLPSSLPRAGKDTGEPAPSPVTESDQEGPEELSRAIRSLLQEQEAKVLATIRTCEEVQAQLNQYQTTLAGWGERQQNLEDRLQALVDQSKDARVFLRQEESMVANKKDDVQQGEQRLRALVEVLRKVTTEQKAGRALVDAARCSEEERQRAEESQGIILDVHIVTTINKVMEASNAALEAASTVQDGLDAATTVQAGLDTACGTDGTAEDPTHPTIPKSSITDELKTLLAPTLKAKDHRSLKQATNRQLQGDSIFVIDQQEGRRRQVRTTVEKAHHISQAEDLRSQKQTTRRQLQADPTFAIHQQEGRRRHARIILEEAPQILQVKDLRSLTQNAKRLLQDGLVFAIHQQEGQNRHARITFEDGRLYLHSLHDQPLLPRAVTVQMDEVVPTALPCLVFLDLAWPGSSSRRVFIRLISDTRLGRQFLMMCTGQGGPTYANTKLCVVIRYLLGAEVVVGGDYTDKTEGAAPLPTLKVGKYRESGLAGAVWGWDYNLGRGAQFGIITREWQNSFFPRVFGDVVEGLEVVVAAAKHSPIEEVNVVDCGVVLWE